VENRNTHISSTTWRAIVTLEDVAVQLDLPIDGEPITSVSSGDLVSLCDNLLGFVPPEMVYKGNSIKLS